MKDEEWYVILNMNCKYEICRMCPKSGLFKGSYEECEKWIEQKEKKEMKDEEMAEEIANKRCHEIMCYGHCSFNSPKHHRCGEWHREYNCALEGLKAGRPQWHLTKNELPELQTATDTGDEYNTLVLCFWYVTDSRGKKTKVYDLDRWYPENDIWESGKQRDEVEAWMYLPEPPEEI